MAQSKDITRDFSIKMIIINMKEVIEDIIRR
jgi:hypothetical protein